MEDNQLELPIIIQSHLYLKISTLLLSFVFIIFGTVLLFFENMISFIIGIFFFIFSIFLPIYVLFTRFGYDGEKIIKKSIFGETVIKTEEIDKIGKVKIFGTVGEVPFSISSVEFYLTDGTIKTMNLRIFPYEQSIPIIYEIQSYLDQK